MSKKQDLLATLSVDLGTAVAFSASGLKLVKVEAGILTS